MYAKLCEVVAEQLLTADTVIAVPTRHVDICCDTVAFLESIAISANFGDQSRELVPGDHRKFIGRIPAVVDAPIRATDTSVLDLDQNLTLANLWNWHFFDFEMLYRFEYSCLHRVCHGIYSLIRVSY